MSYPTPQKHLPRNITGLRAELIFAREILRASAMTVSADYHLGRAAANINEALSEVFDLAMSDDNEATVAALPFMESREAFIADPERK